MAVFFLGPKLKSLSEVERLHRFVEPPLTGSFCDLLWADPLLEEVLGYRMSDEDFADVSIYAESLTSTIINVTSY